MIQALTKSLHFASLLHRTEVEARTVVGVGGYAKMMRFGICVGGIPVTIKI